MDKTKNKKPHIQEKRKTCFADISLMAKKNGIKPIHARNDNLNVEKLKDSSIPERAIRNRVLDWLFAKLAALPGAFCPRLFRRIRNSIGFIFRSIFYISCRYHKGRDHSCLPWSHPFYKAGQGLSGMYGNPNEYVSHHPGQRAFAEQAASYPL